MSTFSGICVFYWVCLYMCLLIVAQSTTIKYTNDANIQFSNSNLTVHNYSNDRYQWYGFQVKDNIVSLNNVSSMLAVFTFPVCGVYCNYGIQYSLIDSKYYFNKTNDKNYLNSSNTKYIIPKNGYQNDLVIVDTIQTTHPMLNQELLIVIYTNSADGHLYHQIHNITLVFCILFQSICHSS